MKRMTGMSGTLACAALLAACSSPRVTNAPPEVVDACEREIALIRNQDAPPVRDNTMPGVETGQDPIDEARRGREEEAAAGIAAWPDHVLMYRCLAGHGVELDVEQASVLAEWEHKLRGNRQP
jgi:hypothetical protein